MGHQDKPATRFGAAHPFLPGQSLTVASVNRDLADYRWAYNYYRPQDSWALFFCTTWYSPPSIAELFSIKMGGAEGNLLRH